MTSPSSLQAPLSPPLSTKSCFVTSLSLVEIAKYDKIWYVEDIHDLRSVETEFPAIAFNDKVSSEKILSCEPTVSSLNDEIDFRISFNDSDDEDYTVVFDKNLFSYKIIFTNDLKMNLENDNEKGMPSLPSPEPTVSCFDDLDFFKEFENEFPAIVYNDTQTSKSDLLIELILSPQHIDEFDLNDKTSLFEYNEEEQKVLYFNDLFPFNIIYPDDLKSEKDNDDNEIDIIHSSKDNEITQGSNILSETNIALPPCDQRHQYLRYEGLQYSDADIVDFEARLARIYRREVHRVQGVSLFTSRALRWLFDIRGPLVHELILEFFSTFRFGEAVTDLDTAGALQFQLGGARRRLSWRQFILALGLHTTEEIGTVGFGISSAGDFLGTTSSYTSIRDPILRLCHSLIACSIVRRSQAPKKVTATNQFYLRGMDVGLVNVPYLFDKYLRLFAPGGRVGILSLEICMEIDDTWAWVALGPERQPNAAAGAPEDAEDAPIIDKGGGVGIPTGCQDFTGTYGEIDDRLGEILHMDDFMYDTSDGG
ncbi:hypothetical protein Tco_0105575 [Tanacetum coccineum]